MKSRTISRSKLSEPDVVHALYTAVDLYTAGKHPSTEPPFGAVKCAKQQKTGAYSEEEIVHLIAWRTRLAEEGKNDPQIVEILVEEMNRDRTSILNKIKNLMQAKRLEPNQNSRIVTDFSPDELTLVIARYDMLVTQGLSTSAIVATISKESGRRKKSLKQKINALIKDGKIKANPNPHPVPTPFTAEEISTILECRTIGIAAGENDRQISISAAKVLVGRNAATIYQKFLRMVGTSKIQPNPNKKAKKHNKTTRDLFKPEELELIALERTRLIQEGKNDGQISRIIAKKLNRTFDVINGKIRSLVKTGVFPKNPNNLKSFTTDELAHISRIFWELVQQGKNNRQIAIRLASKLDRTRGTIEVKMKELADTGQLPPNPNRRGQTSEIKPRVQLTEATDLCTGN